MLILVIVALDSKPLQNKKGLQEAFHNPLTLSSSVFQILTLIDYLSYVMIVPKI